MEYLIKMYKASFYSLKVVVVNYRTNFYGQTIRNYLGITYIMLFCSFAEGNALRNCRDLWSPHFWINLISEIDDSFFFIHFLHFADFV